MDGDKVKSIFLTALEKYPADQRTAYLDGACGGDENKKVNAGPSRRISASTVVQVVGWAPPTFYQPHGGQCPPHYNDLG